MPSRDEDLEFELRKPESLVFKHLLAVSTPRTYVGATATKLYRYDLELARSTLYAANFDLKSVKI